MADPFTILGIGSLITGAVGAGVSYSASRSAANTQDSLALLNAQAQTQAAQQQGQLNQATAQLNERFARKDREAAEANAALLAGQAEAGSKIAEAAARRTREEYNRAAAAQRAALAKGGMSDSTGSPLDLLSGTAEQEQQAVDLIRFEDEESRRHLFRESAMMKNQGVMAGIQGTGYRAAGAAAVNETLMRVSQAKINRYAQRAAASAMRTEGAGNLFTAFGGLASNQYNFWKNKPGN